MTLRQGLLRALVGMVACTFLVGGCDEEEEKGHSAFGYIDTSGAVVIAPRYFLAQQFQEGLAAVSDGSGWGYIDKRGQWAVPSRFLCATPFSNGLAAVQDDRELWGYIDQRGRNVVPPQYAHASPFFDGRAFVTRPGGGTLMIDREGRTLKELGSIELAFPDGDFCELTLFPQYGIAERWLTETWSRVREDGTFPYSLENGRFGFINFRGEVVIEPQDFDEVAPFAEDRAAVKKDGKHGFIDRSGNVVVPVQYDAAISRFSRDRTVVGRSGRAELIDRTGRTVADLGAWPWPGLGENDGFDNVAHDLYGFGDFFADGLMPWPRDGKWGYVDTGGHWVIEPRYDWADLFEDGQASVSVGGHGALIDRQGRETARAAAPSTWIGPRAGRLQRTGTASAWRFTEAAGRDTGAMPFQTTKINTDPVERPDTRPPAFSEGLALVTVVASHRWQRLDEHGAAQADGNFEWLIPREHGLLAYRANSKWGLIDRNFHAVTAARFGSPPEFGYRATQYLRASVDGRVGCVDRQGRWIPLPAGIDRAGCEGSVMWAAKGDRMGMIGMDGRWRVAPEHKNADSFGDPARECFRIVDADVTKLRCRSGSGFREIVVSSNCDSLQRCLVDVGGQLQRLDPSTLRPAGPLYDAAERTLGAVLAVRQGKHWGALGPSGELALPVSYDQLGFNVDHFGSQPSAYYVRQGDRWAALNPKGEPATAPIYDDMGPFWGFLRVRSGGKWGLIAGDGTEIAPPRFDEIVTLRKGLLLVKQDKRYDLATLDGKPLWDRAPDWLQQLHLLTDFSATSWAVLTTDGLLFVIDRHTHAAVEAKAPQGYAWKSPAGAGTATGFQEYFFSSPLEIVPRDGTEITGLRRYVVVGGDGRASNPLLFASADRVEHASGDRYTVTLHGRCGFLDAQGRWLVPLAHDHCIDTDDMGMLVGDDVLR